MNFKAEIKQASSSKTKLVFVKVPDAIEGLDVDNYRNELSGDLNTRYDWFSPKLPEGNYEFVGYSNLLTNEDIERLFSSWQEFYQTCESHKIYYNLSAYTGKWAVLIPTV